MRIYTVYCKHDEPTEAVIIKEGFSHFAFFLAPIWLVMNKLWLGLVLYLIAVSILSYISSFLATPVETRLMICLIAAFYIGLEANNWKCWELRKNGYNELGILLAKNHADAERSWFMHNFKEVSVSPTKKQTPHSSQESFLSIGLVAPLDRA